MVVAPHYCFDLICLHSQQAMVDTPHFLWFVLGMASLKSFLYGAAPILGTTGAALYERQRALVNLGILEVIPGRGPGSGVPLTPDNIAAVIISLLAAENLSDVDKRIVDLFSAIPGEALTEGRSRDDWEKHGKPTFLSEVGRALMGKDLVWRSGGRSRPLSLAAIRVTRPSIGQFDRATGGRPYIFHPTKLRSLMESQRPISITAGIEENALGALINFTQGALSQVEAETEDDE
jgi:hypothetical protein